MKAQAEVSLENGPWSGHDWPNRNMSIDYRAQDHNLSPLEKWELATINDNVIDIRSFLHDENLIDPNAEWDGLCHGYSATSLQYPEPEERMINGVKFLQSDIKAILAVYYHHQFKKEKIKTSFLGTRCNEDLPETMMVGDYGPPGCDDVNPGALHLALQKFITEDKSGVVMDIDRGPAVYNHPLIGYETINNGEFKFWYPDKALNTNKIYEFETTLKYLDVQTPEEENNIQGAKGQKVQTMKVKYTIEVDAFENIVGGEWISYERPDFLWFSTPLEKPKDEWRFLNNLINKI